MSFLGLLFTVLSGVAWAAFDTTRKGLLAHLTSLPALVWLMLGQAPLFAIWWGFTRTDSGPLPSYAAPALATVALNVAASLMFLEALRIAPLSRVIPLLSLTPVLTTVTGFLTLGEWPTATQLLGVLLVAVGAAILAQGKSPDLDAKEGGAATRRGSWLMLGVALLWSLTAALDKVALGSATPAFHGLVQSIGIGAAVLVWLAWRGRLAELRPPRSAARWLALGILTSSAAMGLQFVALGHVLVTLFEAAKRAIGMTLALVLGRWLFGEAITGDKALSVLLMAAGVALVLL